AKAAKAAAPAEAPAAQPATQEQAAPAAPGQTPVEKMSQDDIDSIIAKRAVAKQAGQIGEAPEKDKPKALSQDAIDGMPKKQASKPDLGLKDDEPEPEPEDVAEPEVDRPSLLQRLPLTTLVIVGNSLLLMLAVVVLLNRPKPQPTNAQPPVVIQQPVNPVAANISQGNSQAGQSDPETENFEKSLPIATGSGTNWSTAEQAFAEKAYRLALPQYSTLLQAAGDTAKLASLRDFMRLRIGQCLDRMGQPDQAQLMLEAASRSDSPIVRASAYYEMGRMHARNGQFLLSRAQAYAALTTLGAMQSQTSLAGDCHFLIGRVLTEKALTFYNENDTLRWTWDNPRDPFAGLTRQQFRNLISDGEGLLAGGLLGVEMLPVGQGRNVSIRCRQAPISQLFQRIAAMTDLNVVWDSKVSPASRKRSITMYETSIDPILLAERACGSTGLIARLEGDGLKIYDPRTLDDVKQQQSIYVGESNKIWQRLDAQLPYDTRIAKAHLGMGRMLEAMGDPRSLQSALNNYHQIVNRFGHDAETAPLALLRSVQIYLQVRNFPAAREDLQTLIDQYPTFRADEAWVTLGNVTLESGMVDSARRIYRELYEDNLSPLSRASASFGVGRCFFLQDDHPAAIRWLERYLGYTNVETAHTNDAMYMLGRSFSRTGQHDQAALYLYRALADAATEEQEIRSMFQLARVQLDRDKPMRTLSTLRGLQNFKLTDEQHCDRALLESRAYRAMALPGRAVEAILNARETPGMDADPFRGRLGLEVARGLAANEDPQAIGAYTEVWPLLESNESTWQAGCEMAQLFLDNDQTDQAVAVLEQILKASQQAETLALARKMLTRAYILQQQYDKAAEVAKAGTTEPSQSPDQEDQQ
ncbi:MAG: tetratricopeptide repeat protein, partial [Planctomycetota bacterium]